MGTHNPKQSTEKAVNPEIATSIRELAGLKRGAALKLPQPGMTINPRAIHLQQQQLAANIERSTNGNRAEMAENAMAGMEAMSGASCVLNLASAGVAVLGVLDMISTPMDIAPDDSLAISPDDQLDPATSMIPR